MIPSPINTDRVFGTHNSGRHRSAICRFDQSDRHNRPRCCTNGRLDAGLPTRDRQRAGDHRNPPPTLQVRSERRCGATCYHGHARKHPLITALFLIAGRSIRERYAVRLNALDRRTAGIFTIVLGLVMGVLVTTTSVGAGAIGVTILLFLHPKIPAGRVVGSDIAHAVPLTLLAGAGHWYLGSIDWSLLGNLLVGSLPGIVFGSYLATRARDAVVRIALASVLVIVGVRLLG